MCVCELLFMCVMIMCHDYVFLASSHLNFVNTLQYLVPNTIKVTLQTYTVLVLLYSLHLSPSQISLEHFCINFTLSLC